MIKLRYPSVETRFVEGQKVTLTNGRQGRIYKDGHGNIAYRYNDGIVYVYFLPKHKRNLDLVESIPLSEFENTYENVLE